MSSFTSMQAGGVLRAIKYSPARVDHYGSNGEYRLDVEARVTFYVGDSLVALTVADARDLLEALPTVLAQHDYAEFVIDEPTAGAARVSKAA